MKPDKVSSHVAVTIISCKWILYKSWTTADRMDWIILHRMVQYIESSSFCCKGTNDKVSRLKIMPKCMIIRIKSYFSIEDKTKPKSWQSFPKQWLFLLENLIHSISEIWMKAKRCHSSVSESGIYGSPRGNHQEAGLKCFSKGIWKQDLRLCISACSFDDLKNVYHFF
jgi:hypothetical protein